MDTADTIHTARRALVTAAHHFLLCVLPLRAAGSHDALAAFARDLETLRLPSLDVDAVLLQCLAVLNTHTGGRLPSLVDRYLASGLGSPDRIARFVKSVEDVLTYEGIGDGLVQQAIELVRKGCGDSKLSPRSIAERLNVGLPMLCVSFRRQTGLRMGEYIREARLQQAAGLLLATDHSIKEAWAAAGYNHASNFTHDFKRHFHVTPSEYRQRALRRAAQEAYGPFARPRVPDGSVARPASPRGSSVLLAVADEISSHAIGEALARRGFAVTVARTADAALAETERLSPRVILVDDIVGDVEGIELLRAIRTKPAADASAVILLSSEFDLLNHDDEIERLRARAVSKLRDLDRLTELIELVSSAEASPPGEGHPRNRLSHIKAGPRGRMRAMPFAPSDADRSDASACLLYTSDAADE